MNESLLQTLFWLAISIGIIATIVALHLVWKADRACRHRNYLDMLRRDRQRAAVRKAVREQLDPPLPPEVWRG